MNLNVDLFTSALTDATLRHRALADLQAFLTAGGNPDRRMDTGGLVIGWGTLLTAAATHGWTAAVDALVSAGAEIHANEDAAVRWAASQGHLAVVERLLAAGADVRAGENWALREAAARGHLPVVERLLAAGADVHARADWALRLAAPAGHIHIVERLLAAGADVHACRDEALRKTVEKGNRDADTYAVISMLLAATADIHISHEQPLRAAMDNADVQMCGILLRHGADAVSAWGHGNQKEKVVVAPVLDACATDIPSDQCRILLALAPRLFPAIRALRDAEQRRQDHLHSTRGRQ